MSNTTAIEKIPPSSAVEITPATPMELIASAVSKGATIDTIERLVAMQDKMLARDAELAFNAAMNRAQTALGPVQADLTNPQTRSKYASYAAIDRKVRPVYSKEGLSLSFDTGESPLQDHIRVICHVSHSAGHTRVYHLDMPSDGKGAKGGDVMTKTHAAGAAMSYGMRYLVKMIFNIAVGEDDSDGNQGGAKMADLAEHLEWIANAKDAEELKKLYYAAAGKAKTAGDNSALLRIVAAKDARKRELE